jgi:heme/copper-type cytochrome/quinol oxidase subunit 2
VGRRCSQSINNNPTEAPQEKNNTGVIVGLTVGFIVLLGVAAFLYYYLYKYKKVKGDKKDHESPFESFSVITDRRR